MRLVEWARYPAAFLLTLLPCMAVERVTELFYLTGNPAFGTWSGWRMELFIVSVLLAGVISGAIFARLVPAALSCSLGVATFLLYVFSLCDPRLCYSTGLDGLEPARLGLFLLSVSFASTSVGVYIRDRAPLSERKAAVVGLAVYYAVGFYPMYFTFAGTRLLGPLAPWPAVVLFFLLSFALSASVFPNKGFLAGLAVPFISGGALLTLAWLMAFAYISTIELTAVLIAAAVISGALAGRFSLFRRRDWTGKHFSSATKPVLTCMALALLMTTVLIPDAVVGLAPAQSGSPGGGYSMSSTVYAGGYMDAPLGNSLGVALNVSFAGTDPSIIGPGNFLSAGIGIHGAGCCVDGIDYGYRFDVYLFHDGDAALVASAWEVCDHNAACGGHSWKVLMLQKEDALAAFNVSVPVHLVIRWQGREVVWSYSVGAQQSEFVSFTPASAENADWVVGTIPNRGLYESQDAGYYFFQFGVTSLYPVASDRWSVSLGCPATLVGGAWKCIQHAGFLQGGQSYWKVFWRWGEDYPGVSVIGSSAASRSFELGYVRGSGSPDFLTLW